MEEIRIHCPAKLNLHLKILGLRTDGYHELYTLMHPISLFDEIRLKRERGSGISLSISGGEIIPKGKENLVYKAADLFYKKIGKQPDLSIKLTKRIPVGAGLGGGSSDAAGVLWGLNRLWGFPINRADLTEIGLLIGSDVPFFLYGKTAICRGRGEKIIGYKNKIDYYFVIIKPPFSISTSWAYKMYDELPDSLKLTKDSLLNILDNLKFKEEELQYLENDLEKAVFKNYAVLEEIKEALKKRGSLHSLMTGSGSAIFGMFKSRKEAEDVGNQLNLGSEYRVIVARSLKKSYNN